VIRFGGAEIGARSAIPIGKTLKQEMVWMRAKALDLNAIVFHHFPAHRHGCEDARRFRGFRQQYSTAIIGGGEPGGASSRKPSMVQAASRVDNPISWKPSALAMPYNVETSTRGATPQSFDLSKGKFGPIRDDAAGFLLLEAFHHAEAKLDGTTAPVAPFERVVPV
jgi:hypothetical protein